MPLSDNVFLTSYLVFVLITAGVIDWRSQKIPNLLTFPTMVLALAGHGLINGMDGVWFSMSGLAAGIGVFIIPFLMGGMGAGDAKLMGAAGAVLGPRGIFIAFIFTALIGGVYSLILIVTHRTIFKGFFDRHLTTLITFLFTRQFIPEPMVVHEKKPRLCYGIAIALGTLTYVMMDLTGYQFNMLPH
ncbi:MAG: prepilin peptidase [Desulfobacterales bacterium]|nr:prepilin peptidase [Desulfobacterales bacterium]MDD4391123.1 prepilin peptidase [Desulfobacterales bacterium]